MTFPHRIAEIGTDLSLPLLEFLECPIFISKVRFVREFVRALFSLRNNTTLSSQEKERREVTEISPESCPPKC